MQDHRFDFVIDGTPEEVWEVYWRGMRRNVDSPGVSIEILHPGDDQGNGLVRHCTFAVPKYLLSGGVGQSWEWITQAVPPESWRYDAVGKPLWSKASGWTRFERLDDGKTRVWFRETYEAFNPVSRLLFERKVHDFISKDNDRLIEAHLVRSLERYRTRRSAGSEPGH